MGAPGKDAAPAQSPTATAKSTVQRKEGSAAAGDAPAPTRKRARKRRPRFVL
jgi:hypothetical protein